MITFFTTTEKFNTQFQNSLESWHKLNYISNILVYTNMDSSYFSNYSKVNLVRYEQDPPYVSDMFMKSIDMSSDEYLCFVNSDIMFLSDLQAAFNNCKDIVENGIFQMMGRRTNWHNWKRLDVMNMTDDQIKEEVNSGNTNLHGTCHADWFLFHKTIYEDLNMKLNGLPKFYIARTTFDNWFSYAPRFVGYPNVNATNKVFTIHHDESRKKRENDWAKKPNFWKEVEYNRRLFQQYLPPGDATLEHSTEKSADVFL